MALVTAALGACEAEGGEPAGHPPGDGAAGPPPTVDPDDDEGDEAASDGQQAPGGEPSPSPSPSDDPDGADAAEVGADELGEVPVLMYHRLLDGGGGEYDRTPESFRSELEWLFDHDYAPVLMRDVIEGRIDVPAGTKPVVLTFDDSPREHVALDDDGEPEPDTALGILEDVAADHDHADPVAVWSVLPDPFGGHGETGEQLMSELVDRGHELANHTCRHESLAGRDREDIETDLACGAAVVADAVDEPPRTLTLPLGTWPDEREWAEQGDADGGYDHDGILLVGSNPARSPFHREFEPLAVPRIRSGDDADPAAFESAFWLDRLESTGDAYVSDGDPDTVSFPADRADQLDDAFADRANPYEP